MAPPVRINQEREWWLARRHLLDDIRISYRSRRLVEIRYGLDSGNVVTLEAVGAPFGISRERVRQVINQTKWAIWRIEKEGLVTEQMLGRRFRQPMVHGEVVTILGVMSPDDKRSSELDAVILIQFRNGDEDCVKLSDIREAGS